MAHALRSLATRAASEAASAAAPDEPALLLLFLASVIRRRHVAGVSAEKSRGIAPRCTGSPAGLPSGQARTHALFGWRRPKRRARTFGQAAAISLGQQNKVLTFFLQCRTKYAYAFYYWDYYSCELVDQDSILNFGGRPSRAESRAEQQREPESRESAKSAGDLQIPCGDPAELPPSVFTPVNPRPTGCGPPSDEAVWQWQFSHPSDCSLLQRHGGTPSYARLARSRPMAEGCRPCLLC
ncbi:hypothetical protein GGR56DRAFT_580178 [Xylariaceae sp. FL0804]|nr:hypothetical protein GGR56DRAFT_580178 [Xylariaceae sp. FL0804]